MVVFRLAGLAVFAPVFGSPAIPARLKMYLTLVIGAAIYPVISPAYVAAVPQNLDMYVLAPMVAMEIAIGLMIGFLASMPMLAMQTGGLLMGQQMGLGFARFYNPAIDDEADVVGQMLFFMALAGFLMIGGLEAMLLAVMNSFDHVGPGGFLVDANVLAFLSGMLLASFEVALRVAAPLLTLVFLESLALGFISKTVPQLNILSLGFPLRILVGLSIIAMGLVVIDEVMMENIDWTLNTILEWVESS